MGACTVTINPSSRSRRNTDRLSETGAVSSVGSHGDCYGNALVNGLYITELARDKGPWRRLGDLELATLGWVDWFNHRRLFESHGYIPSAEYEAAYYIQRN